MTVMLTGDIDGIEKYSGPLKPVIKRCLNLNPQDRYSSALELQKALQKTLHAKSNTKTKSRNSVLFFMCGIIGIFTILIAILIISLCLFSKSKNGKPASSDTTVTEAKEDEFTQLLQSRNKPTKSDENITSPVGVYSGDDNEILVIAEDGLAYYYCITESFTELECPWTVSDDTITISFSKMHCDVTASTSNGYASLIFRSSSANWNTEEFIWISSDCNSYIKETPPTVREDVNVLHNGDMQIVLDDVQFTIPKNFMDYGDDSRLKKGGKNSFIFVDNDSANGYLANAVFYSESTGLTNNLDSDYETMALDFAQRFFTNTQIGQAKPVTVAGYDGYSVTISCLLNNGFSLLKGTIYSGPVIIIYDEKYNDYIYILFSQVVGSGIDDTELFEMILSSAEIK